MHGYFIYVPKSPLMSGAVEARVPPVCSGLSNSVRVFLSFQKFITICIDLSVSLPLSPLLPPHSLALQSCQADLVKDNGHKYFLSVLADPYMPVSTVCES